MKSFEEWFKEKHLSLSIHANAGFEKDLEVKNIAKSAFTAGQQSKQAEVDELKREMLNKTNEAYADGQKSMRKMIKSNEDELQNKYDAMYRAFTVADDCRKEWHRCYVGVRQREDELQKRIDLALDVIYKEKSAVECDKYIGVDADLIIGIGYDLHKILKGDSHEY